MVLVHVCICDGDDCLRLAWTMQSVRAALPLVCLLLLLLLLLLRCWMSLAARRVLCAAALVSGVRVSDCV
jgi:hypothetical protein